MRNARMAKRCSVGQVLAVALLGASLIAPGSAAVAVAADCPAMREPRLPPIEEPAANIDMHKRQLRAYHVGDYTADIKLVLDDALAYIMGQLDKVKRPAIVLDIDETSLSNWSGIDADDFGFIEGGACPLKSTLPCGFNAWIMKGHAPKIDPTLTFFDAVQAKRVAIFFVTGRRDSQRRITIRNLKRAGFKNWTGLRTRPDDDHSKSIIPFKSGERVKIEKEGYSIIASIGDQLSDFDGGHAECGFKLPNPFYFVP
jgi:acid phosphatase